MLECVKENSLEIKPFVEGGVPVNWALGTSPLIPGNLGCNLTIHTVTVKPQIFGGIYESH